VTKILKRELKDRNCETEKWMRKRTGLSNKWRKY